MLSISVGTYTVRRGLRILLPSPTLTATVPWPVSVMEVFLTKYWARSSLPRYKMDPAVSSTKIAESRLKLRKQLWLSKGYHDSSKLQMKSTARKSIKILNIQQNSHLCMFSSV